MFWIRFAAMIAHNTFFHLPRVPRLLDLDEISSSFWQEQVLNCQNFWNVKHYMMRMRRIGNKNCRTLLLVCCFWQHRFPSQKIPPKKPTLSTICGWGVATLDDWDQRWTQGWQAAWPKKLVEGEAPWIGPMGTLVKFKGPIGGCPQKTTPSKYFVTTTNILSLRIFFQTRLVCSTSFCVDFCFFTKRKAGKGVETMARLKGNMAVKKTFESTACVLLIWESRRPLKKSAIAKAERIKHLNPSACFSFYIPKVSFDGFWFERYEEFPV